MQKTKSASSITATKTKAMTGTKLAVAVGFLAIAAGLAISAAASAFHDSSNIPDLTISMITMNNNKVFPIENSFPPDQNAITIMYLNKGDNKGKKETAPDKPFSISLQFAPHLPDGQLFQLKTPMKNPTFVPVPKKKSGVYEIPVDETYATSAGTNVYSVTQGGAGTVHLYFSPYKAKKSFTKFSISATVDNNKIIKESNEKNNTKKVEIPAKEVKLASPPKANCVFDKTQPPELSIYEFANSITITSPDGIKQTLPDTCGYDKKTLTEYSCNNSGTWNAEQKDCNALFSEAGKGKGICINGACIEDPSTKIITCEDSDGGDTNKKGSVTILYGDNSKKVFTDSCQGGAGGNNTLKEYSCNDNLNYVLTNVSCMVYGQNYICKDGACVK